MKMEVHLQQRLEQRMHLSQQMLQNLELLQLPIMDLRDLILQELEENPGLVNEDCYGRGWMYRIRPDDKAELQGLIHGPEAVRAWLLADIAKFAKP